MANSSLIVLIDGPRGSGKSTIANGIVDFINTHGATATYFKKGVRSEANETTNMLQHIRKFQNNTQDVTVVDRFLLTEWVMSTWNNRIAPRPLFLGCTVVNNFMVELGVMHYYLETPSDVLGIRINKRETRGWDIHPEVVTPLWSAAAGIFKGVKTIENTEDDDGQSVIDIIVRDIHERLVKQNE